MSFAASRHSYWFSHLLITAACLLVLPGGPTTSAAAVAQSSSAIQLAPEAASRSREQTSQRWLWLLLGIAPVGVALPWLYRWHRSNRSPIRQTAPPISVTANSAVTAGSAALPTALPTDAAAAVTHDSASQPAPPQVSPSPNRPPSVVSSTDVQPAASAAPPKPIEPPHASEQPIAQPASQPVAAPAEAAPVKAAPAETAIETTLLEAAPVESSITRLAKIDIVEALTTDLHSPDSAKRNKAIWELGQRGDSRAIQPLVDLLVDADSQQRSLILAALAEISTRTLKPMQRALMLSLQDESPDVRKNAIRDMTRVYDLMAQASQLLQYAANDSDEEVKDTARWALGQLNRIRSAELGSHSGKPSLQSPE